MKKFLSTLFLSAGIYAFAQIPTNGLQLHYSFNNGSSIDDSGNNNNGSATNVTYTTDRFGNSSSAAQFNGTNTFVTMPNNMLTSSAVSVSLWIKTATNNRPILGQQDRTYPTPGNTHVPVLYLRNNGVLNAGFWTGTQRNLNTNNVNLANNQWHHIVISASGSGHDIYIDGTLATASTRGRQNLNMIRNALGAARTSSWPGITASTMRYYSGEMDDVRVYNRTLLASEVTGLFNEFNTTLSPLLQPNIFYSFNGANARDTSGNNNHATPTNVNYTTDRFGNSNHALDLNTGATVNAYLTLPNSSFFKTEMTVSTWFKTDQTGGVIASQQSRAISSAPGGSYVPIAYVRTDSTLNAGFWQGGAVNSKTIPVNVVDNQWHHLVITTGASGQDIYLDDSLMNTTTTTQTLLGLPNTYLGGGTSTSWPGISNGVNFFKGALDDFKLYDFKVTASDVTNLYTEADPMNPVVYIPDSTFKAYLVGDTLINLNRDNEIQFSEANAFNGWINFIGTVGQPLTQISDFTGIEAFVNATRLNNFRNRATSIDLSANTNLEEVWLQLGTLTSVNLQGLTRLKRLNLNGNNLTSVNLSTNDSLEYINFNQNNFTTLSFPVLPRMAELYAEGCVSMTDIDLTGLDSLVDLSLSGNTLLDTVDISNMLKIEEVEIDFSGVRFLKNTNTPSLEDIEAARSNLDSINLQNSPNLNYVIFSETNLTYLDVSNLPLLSQVICANSQLNTFIVGNNPFLRFIDVPDNNLTAFDPSAVGRNFLSRVWLSGNNISSLDFSGVVVSNVWVDSTNLSILNLKNGSNVSRLNSATTLRAVNNPSLTCIQVDSVAFSQATWTNVDPGVTFDTNCNYITSLSSAAIENQLKIYPNPSNGIFNLENAPNVLNIEVYGFNGQKIEEVSIQSNRIDLSNQPQGIYFLRLTTTKGTLTKKLIRQ